MTSTPTASASPINSTAPPSPTDSSPTQDPRSAKTSLLRPILGGTLGGICLFALLTALICLCRKRKAETPNSQPSHLSELDVPQPYTPTLPVLHELPEEEAPTFAWHKLWKPTFSYQSRYSDGIPDSPTLGSYPKSDPSERFPGAASAQSGQPTSPPRRQELSAEYQVSPQQGTESEQDTLDRATVSPLSAYSGGMSIGPRSPVMDQAAFHQDCLQNSDRIEKAPTRNQESSHEIQ